MDATLGAFGTSRNGLAGASRASLAIPGFPPRRCLRAAALLTALTICLVDPARAHAQETRSEAIRQEQVDRQQIVTPPQPNRAEVIISRIGDMGFPEGKPQAPAGNVVAWSQFDSGTGVATCLGSTEAAETGVPAPQHLPMAPGTFLVAAIAAQGGPESWSKPVHAYRVRWAAGWRPIGFERVLEGNPPQSPAAQPSTARR